MIDNFEGYFSQGEACPLLESKTLGQGCKWYLQSKEGGLPEDPAVF